MNKKINIKKYTIRNANGLETAERKYRGKNGVAEREVWAIDTPYTEIAETVIKDRRGPWATPLSLFVSKHKTTIGARNLSSMAEKFINESDIDCDILSIQSDMGERNLMLVVLLRIYKGGLDIQKFFDYIGDDLYDEDIDKGPAEGGLIIPDSIKNFKYTDSQKKRHSELVKTEKKAYDECSLDKPFLNSIKTYEPLDLPNPADDAELIYDLETKDRQLKIVGSYEDFNRVFKAMMEWVTGTEYNHYVISLTGGEAAEKEFIEAIKTELTDKYVKTGKLPAENFPAMMDKLYRSLYQLYIVQDLIDDPNITDIKITAPDSIRVRIKGKAYLSNVTFVNLNDYRRFIDMLAIRNGIRLNIPEQTFTDPNDENYILRFSITAAYVNSVAWPYLHIRKVARKKPLGDDLIKAGMFDEKIKNYLLDCGKHSRGVVFAGPPGCVDRETEFFNGKEWKSIAEWNNEPVLQFDVETNEASLVMPIRYIKEPCNKMYHFETKYGIDQTLSAEHRVLYYTKTHKNNIRVYSKMPKEISAEKMAEFQNDGHFYGAFKTDFKYSGKGITLSDNEIKLMLAVICDGTFDTRVNNSSRCYINIKKDRKKKELEDILASCSLDYHKSDREDGYSRYSFIAPRKEKCFSSYWYNCSSKQLQLICDNVLKWDGYIDKDGHRTFSTTSKETADFIQFAFSACGNRAYISTMDRRGKLKNTNGKSYQRKSIEYTVCISKNTYVGMGWHNDERKNNTLVEEVIPEDGYKYCFTVPSHALVLRRNDKIFITGNCGKTVILNWFLEEAYEQSAEILVIQENDELFAYRKGVMFQHVVNYTNGKYKAVSLEELGQLALVAGANVFIIGEAKGAEICSAITLSNSGCRTAITIHSQSSTETIDKMADLAMRGYAKDIDQAKRMLKSFQTIVYLKDFKVQEISEIVGYDEEKHDMKYKYIYRRDKESV